MPQRIVSHLSVNAELRVRLIHKRLIFFGKLVRLAGLEPATSWFVVVIRKIDRVRPMTTKILLLNDLRLNH